MAWGVTRIETQHVGHLDLVGGQPALGIETSNESD